MLARFKQKFIPNRVLVVVDENQVAAYGKIVLPVFGKTAINGKATAYVCENGMCTLPTGDVEEFVRQL